MNLTDLLVAQNNGAAVDQLSRQFGLNQQQTISAIEALMPAFSQGLKRNAGQASGAASLIEALATGRHAQYADYPNIAGSANGIMEGDAILGHLFGNKDVSRAVAAHASQSSGIGSAILKKMLPVIASMIMGSLFKGAMGGSRGGGLGGALGQAAGGGILGKIIEGLAGGALKGGLGGNTPRRRQPRRGSSPNSLEDLLGQMMGGGRRRAPQRTNDPVMPPTRRGQRRTSPADPLGDIFGELTGSRPRRRTNPYTPQPRQQRRPRGGGLGEIFGDMLEPGGNTDTQYQRETGSVFDEFLGRR